MATFFDEKKLKEALSNMQTNEREQFVNEFLDFLGIGKLIIGNTNLDTAYSHLGTAITMAKTMELTPQEKTKLENYFQQLGIV